MITAIGLLANENGLKLMDSEFVLRFTRTKEADLEGALGVDRKSKENCIGRGCLD